ncbi:F-box protein PP2-B15 [Striga hermonthica]|uniref:F-box protein PP2-B15 n=1 Tax=Striga hermonthica TaxID=68872 RepID=A0A9N7NQ53_STRHE|nr:F-box protein PP2-B15 [Striga hermonthica]
MVPPRVKNRAEYGTFRPANRNPPSPPFPLYIRTHSIRQLVSVIEMARSVGELPEECLSHVVSLTCPRDACRSSAVCGAFRDAADSDLTWEKFLPSDYREIVSRSVCPPEFVSKKELFEKLSAAPLLIDGGNKTFCVDKYTNKRCYMLSARELSITWSSNPLCWCWKPTHMSRFPESIELISVCRLEILGKFDTRMLSPNTTYGAYLVFQMTSRAFGLSASPFEVSVEVGDCKKTGRFYLKQDECKGQEESDVSPGALSPRGDGWSEVELGEFYVGGGAQKEVKMEFKEVKSEHLKGGLLVDGIELRPKHFF